MNIAIISGSTRGNSLTHRAALYLEERLKHIIPDARVDLIDLRKYNPPPIEGSFTSVEKMPECMQPVAENMINADAVIIVTPEYNGTFSPAISNWFGHFPKQSHKAFGLVTASNGALGGMRAALQLQHYVLALFGVPSPQMLIIGQVDKKFDETGHLLVQDFQLQIDRFVSEFLWLANRLKS